MAVALPQAPRTSGTALGPKGGFRGCAAIEVRGLKYIRDAISALSANISGVALQGDKKAIIHSRHGVGSSILQISFRTNVPSSDIVNSKMILYLDAFAAD